MAKQLLSTRRGAPRDLELSYGWGYRNLEVRQRGRLLGTIASRTELTEGRTFTLDDRSTLSVKLVGPTWLAPELEVLRNGVPLPGSATDPLKRLNSASNVVFLVAGLSLLIALLRWGSAPDEALGMAMYGALFLLLGFFTRKGSLAAAVTALALYLIDAIGGLALGVVAPGAIVIRGLISLMLVRGIAGIRECRRRGLLPAPEGRLWRMLAWAPAVLALLGLSLVYSFYRGGEDAGSVFARVSPSVVVVVHDGPGDRDSQGSGVVVGAGRVITNGHVVGPARQVEVYLAGKAWPAQVVRHDPSRDLAELMVPNLPAPPVPLRAGIPDVGERVYAVGAPHGLELTLSEGLVSSLRVIHEQSAPLIQTSAPISPGSSGGGLFDSSGRLVGWTTFQFAEGQNLNFAVPVAWLEGFERRQPLPGGLAFFRPPEAERVVAAGSTPPPAQLRMDELLGPGWERDQAAVLEQIRSHPFGFDSLRDVLRSADGPMRSRAAQVLAALHDDPRAGAAWALVGALRDERDPGVQVALLNAVRNCGTAGDLALGELATASIDSMLRREGIDALGRQGSAPAIRSLVQLVAREPDPDLREAARLALAQSGDQGARLLLSELAHCSGPSSCIPLIDTLGQLGADAAVARDKLWELRDRDVATREAADRALARIDAARQ